jgi:hypothetical protein
MDWEVDVPAATEIGREIYENCWTIAFVGFTIGAAQVV